MEVTRTSLRAQRNPVPRQVRQGLQTQQKGGYGEEARQKLETLGDVRRDVPVIQAKRVDPIVSPTEQYTEDAIKTALKEELKKFISSRGLGGDTSGATEQTAPFAGSGGGGNKPDFFSGLTNDQLGLLSTDQLVARDNKMYGDTFPDGAIGIGSKSTDDFSQNPEYQSTAGDFAKEQLAKVMSSLPSDYKQTEQRAFDDAEAYRKLVASGLDKTVSGEDAQVNVGSGRLGSFGLGTAGEGAPTKPPEGSFGISTIKRDDQAERMGGQGGLPLGTTTQRQGGTVEDGVKVAKTESPAVNASSFLQKNVRGSTSFSGTGKDESARPTQVKQTVASLPSNYAATEKAAFDKAKAYKASKADSKAKGDAAAKATNTPSKPPAGSFGISAAGKQQAEANKAEKNKPTEAQKTAIKKATTVKKSSPSTSTSTSKSTSKSRSKSNTGSKKSSRGGSKSGGGSKGGSKSGGSKGTSGSKKSSRGARGGSSSRSRGGTSKSSSRRGRTGRGGRRGGRRCDIRCKFDISLLTNMNLLKDDLAELAYFVKDLQEIK